MELVKRKLKQGITFFMPVTAAPLINEIWEKEVYNRAYSLKENDIVLDVGANIGVFSLYAASRGAKVFSFEPNPEVFAVLQENIRINNLENRVTPLNMALGDHKGKATLFMALSEKIYAPGSASIMRDFIDDLDKRYGKNDYTAFTVSCLRLDQALDLLRLKMVDFMKVDCEGAEYDIMQSVPQHRLGEIRRIAMEIHIACYSQKELCRILRQKGYVVNEFEKADESSLTGFLYCTHSAMGITAPGKPVAVLSVRQGQDIDKDYVFCNQSVIFDGSRSFITNGGERKPVFKWSIDEINARSQAEKWSYRFTEPGYHRVTLCLRHDRKSDSAEKELMVLQADYFRGGVDHYLSPLREDTGRSDAKCVTFHDGVKFSIRSDHLPATRFGQLLIELEIKSFPGEPLSGLQEQLLLFEMNGRKIVLGEPNEKILMDTILYGIDAVFTLTPYIYRGQREISIKWGIPDTISNIQEGNKPDTAPPAGETGLYLFRGEKLFTIGVDMFPPDWTPREIVIDIKPSQYRGKKTALSGFLCYGKRVTALSGWKDGARIKKGEWEDDFSFSINLPTENCLRLTWWPE